jgi:hypothetical protein
MDRARAGDRQGRAGKAPRARLSPLGAARDPRRRDARGLAWADRRAQINPAEMVGTALVAITPAVSQFVLFFGTLVFFLATNSTLRQKMIIFFVAQRTAAHDQDLERH